MQQDYKILPKRNGKSDGSFRRLQTTPFLTNYYEVGLRAQKTKIYQYDIKLEDIPQDSDLYHRAVMSIKKNLKQDIEYLTHKGQMIWGMKSSKITMNYNCRFEFQEKNYQLVALVSQRKQVSFNDLNDPATRPQLLQILNINLKQVLRASKLYELGKSSKYFKINQMDQHDQLREIGLDVIRGFKFTLAQLNRGICLQVDTCSRVLQSRNLLEIFNSKGEEEIRKTFEGSSVITRYGRYRSYKIEQIDFDKTPKTKFTNESKGIEQTYSDYYKEMYGLTVHNNKQPLIKVVGRYRREIKNGKLQEIPEYIYLIPELISPTGMTDQQRANFGTMKVLSNYTKLTPNQRIKDCSQIIHTLNQMQSLIEIKNNIRMDGYCLPKPDIQYSGSTIKPDEKGAIRHRGLLKEPFNFTDWMFVYSVGKNSKRDDEDADTAVDLLTKAGKTYGLKFKDPGFLTINSNKAKDWIEDIKEDVNKNGLPQILVVYLSPYEEKLYPDLKRFITNELKCPSQFIRKKTLTNPKGAMSAASKICIQMNIKVGATPWAVQIKHDYFKKRNCMYGAISLSKGTKGKFTLAFVGTINNECTKVFSDCKVDISSKDSIPVKDLENIFVEWAKSFFQANNKKVPETIILYREGLSDAQAQDQLARSQIPALEGMVNIIGQKTKTKNYKPELMIVLVNKKINSRFYNMGRSNSQQPHKFLPEVFNPDSGSVIIENMSNNDDYDFHLASQLVTQGTCTPTQFKVAFDKTNMPQQALIEFTFNQCFNYYNWQGAVRVPACLQCANKLSKLVGQSIKQSITQSALTKRHFFL